MIHCTDFGFYFPSRRERCAGTVNVNKKLPFIFHNSKGNAHSECSKNAIKTYLGGDFCQYVRHTKWLFHAHLLFLRAVRKNSIKTFVSLHVVACTLLLPFSLFSMFSTNILIVEIEFHCAHRAIDGGPANRTSEKVKRDEERKRDESSARRKNVEHCAFARSSCDGTDATGSNDGSFLSF